MSAWEPLAPRDPVPGDPAELRAGAHELAALVEHIDAATHALRSCAGQPLGQSAAVERVTEVAADAWDDVVALRERYTVAAQQLDSYARVLDASQRDAEQLRVLARQEDEERRAASAAARDAGGELQTLVDATSSSAYAAAAAAHLAAMERSEMAARRIAALQRDLDQVTAAVRDAGDRAAGAIRDAVRADGVRDSWFERVGLAALERISAVASVISTLAGTAALIVVWVPFVGQASATLLAGVALASGVVALGADIALRHHGSKSWADVAWSLVGVGGGLAGRAVGASTKTFRAIAAPTVRSAARRAAARPANEAWRAGAPVPGRSGARLAKRLGGDAYRRPLPVRTHGARGAAHRGVPSRTGSALAERRLLVQRLDPRARRMHLAGIDLESAHIYRALSYTAQRDPALAATVAPQLVLLDRAARLQVASTAVSVAQVPATTHSLVSR